MLQAIDTLIGFVLIMLLLSNAVTFIVQAISSLLNMRGAALLKGVADILIQVQPRLETASAKKLADAVLRHPLVGGPSTWMGIPLGKRTLAAVITREELVQVLLSLAADDELPKGLKKAVDALLTQTKITAPKTLLDDIRGKALELEEFAPEVATSVRMSQALIDSMKNQGQKLLSDLYATFDNTMTRVTEIFVGNARIATLMAALTVTFLIPVDSIQLFRALWVNPQLRASLVERATSEGESPQSKSIETIDEMIRTEFCSSEDPSKCELILGSAIDFSERMGSDWWQKHIFGLLITVILLCLGAQFWFDMLKNLLKLRPVLAGKEEKERASRSEGDLGNRTAGDLAARSAQAQAGVRNRRDG